VTHEEVGVGHARLRGVPPCQSEHFLGHVEAIGDPGGADAARGEQHVDAAARAEVEDRLALAELRDGDRVATAEAGESGRLGQLASLGVVVQSGAEPLVGAAHVAATVVRAAARVLPAIDGECRLGVAATDLLPDLVDRLHAATPSSSSSAPTRASASSSSE
jgi:hypothetical protein